jgi:hypothetical protein
MEQQTATEPTTEVAAKPQALPALEVWAENERMRHVPLITWIADKLDHDVRQRLEKILAAVEPLATSDPRRAAIDEALRSVCGALDRAAEAARHSRPATAPAELANRISWSMNNAVSSLRTVDANSFGRRYPYNTFDRSKAECVYAALLVVLNRLERVIPLVREVDPTIDESLLQGLVNLEEPMRQEPMA